MSGEDLGILATAFGWRLHRPVKAACVNGMLPFSENALQPSVPLGKQRGQVAL